MDVYLVDGKPYGLTANQIQVFLDSGISTFDQALEAFFGGALDEQFDDNQEWVLVAESLFTYHNKHRSPGNQKALHLIADAPEHGFTDLMIRRLHEIDVYTIKQAIDATSQKKIREKFPDILEYVATLTAIKSISDAFIAHYDAITERQSRAELGFRHCQYGPSLN